MKKAVLVLVALFLAYPCFAEKAKQETASGWTMLGLDDSNNVWMVDMNSIEGSGPACVSVWTSQKGEKRTSFARFEFWCDTKQFAITAGREYDDKGKVLGSFEEKAPEWRSIGGGTMAEHLCSEVCTGPDKGSGLSTPETR